MNPQTFIVSGRPPQEGAKVDISSGLGLPAYNHIDITYPTDTTEQYVFKSGATTVATVLLTYSDSTKTSLTTVQKS